MLDQWLEDNGKTRAWLAAKVGTSVASISRIAAQKQRPSLDLAVKLERETKIPAKTFNVSRAA